jgi:hypothetical protein
MVPILNNLLDRLTTRSDGRRRQATSTRRRRRKQHRGAFLAGGARTLRVEPLEDRRLLTVFNLVPGVADGDPGSLRQAVTNASSGDEIRLAAGTYTLTKAGADEDSGQRGDIDVVAKQLTISGAGPESTVLDASALGDRVWHVLMGSDVSISGMTITGGNVAGTSSFSGGGIQNDGGTLNLSHVVVTSNDGLYRGGGLYNGHNGQVLIDSASFTANRLSGNWSLGGGGAIYNDSGTIAITNSVLTNHSVAGRGAAVYNNDAMSYVDPRANAVTIGATTMQNNSAAMGGAIYNIGIVSITGSTLSGNSASVVGGAIYNLVAGELSVASSRISGNSGGANGGAIENGDNSVVAIMDSTLDGNSAATGGAINSGQNSTLTVRNSTLSNNRALNGSGGGISAGGRGAVTLVNVTVSGNAARSGGGLAWSVFDTGSVNIVNATVTRNSATSTGGGISDSSDFAVRPRIKNSIIAGNTDTGGMPDVEGFLASQGHNILGISGGLNPQTTNGFIDPSDQRGNASSPVNPRLGPLADNGGSTLTHRPLLGSPAIDAGDNSGAPSTDQRGVARPVDSDGDGNPVVEIGAVEDGDDDHDGLSESVEKAAPNDGDGNNDGVPDSQHVNVSSLPNANDGGYVTIVSLVDTSLSDVGATGNPSPGDAPANVDFPIGFLDFAVDGIAPGGVTTVTLIAPAGTTFSTYYKYGPTPDNAAPHWYEFLYDGTTGAEFDGNIVTLHFVDGQRGDSDLAENGTIVDPGAPGHVAQTNSPPVADAGGPYMVGEGAPLVLDAKASSDPDSTNPPSNNSDIVLYAWDLDYDGVTFDANFSTTSPIAAAPAFPDDFATRDIALRVTDSQGETDLATSTLMVCNLPPTITSISGPQTINEGQSVTVSGTFSDSALGVASESFTGTAAWSDGVSTAVTIVGGTFSTLRTFADDDPTGTSSDAFTVSVTISDDDLGSDSETSPMLTVHNAAPANLSLSLSATSIDEGDSTELSGSFIDPGTLDTHTVTIDWGDGSANTALNLAAGVTAFTGVSHTYLEDGPSPGNGTASDNYSISVSVADDDGGVTATMPLPQAGSWWRAQGNALDSADESPGTLVNGTSFASGLAGSAFALDGVDDYVLVPNSASLQLNSAMTLEAWVRLDHLPPDAINPSTGELIRWYDVLSKDNPGFPNKLRVQSDGSAKFYLSTSAGISFVQSDPGKVSAGVFTHLVGTYASGQMALYVNGEATVAAKSGTLFADNGALEIAVDSYNHRFVPGLIDEVAVYNRALSPAEVLALFNAGGAPRSPHVTVNNVAPTLSLTGVAPIEENDEATVSGMFTDIGLQDVHTVTIDWGDPNDATVSQFTLGPTDVLGTGPISSNTSGDTAILTVTSVNTTTGEVQFNVTHQYLDDGDSSSGNNTPSDTSTISVTVADDDTGTASQSQMVVVTNVAPVVTLLGPAAADEGQTKSYTFTTSDPGTDTFTIVATSGGSVGTVSNLVFDAATGAGSFDVTFSDGPAISTVSVRLKDSDNDLQSNVSEIDVTVANVAPVVDEASLTNSSPECGLTQAGEPISVSVAFRDAGFDSPAAGSLEAFASSTIDWGDGTVEMLPGIGVSDVDGAPGVATTGVVSGTHAYADGGVYTVTITVMDDDGGSDVIATQVVTAGVGLVDGVLYIIGSPYDDRIHVWENHRSDKIVVEVQLGRPAHGHDDDRREHRQHGANAGSDGGHDHGHRNAVIRRTFRTADVTRIVVDACAGDDHVHLGDVSDGGSDGGADCDHRGGGDGGRHGGSDGHSEGGSDGGHDLPIAATIDGGAGDDYLRSAGGDDDIDGGGGDDRIYSGGGDDLIVDLLGNNHIHAGAGSDTITTGNGADRIWADGGNDVVVAGAGLDEISGGDGDDILVGGDGNDTIDGGSGRDLLIGGRGKDDLKGNEDDDLLIGGSTSFDDHVASLKLIMAEWSSGREYAMRAANLRNGSGPVLTGSGVRLKSSGSDRTVFDDGAKDTLQGDDGRDWFFADLDGTGGDDDKVKDKKNNELVDMILDLP